ncbi:MAG: helix-turn-helix domain-containing protein [Mobilitalea sp.]
MLNSSIELSPKQPEFVLATTDYAKRSLMKHNIAHFYQFVAETDKMGVIPDACVDILFWKKDGKINSMIAGTRLEKQEIKTELKSEYFGIRFMPGINPINGIIKLSELVNNEEIFEDMIPSSDEKERLLDGIYFANTFEDKINVFINFYSNHFDKQIEDKHSLKYVLLDKIIKADGDLKLMDLCDFTGYSQRYLNKIINKEYGVSPKDLIQFIRFQKAIGNLTGTLNHTNCISTALETGYYDQSHFNKEFKKFSGLTPKHYVENLLTHSYDKKLHIR